MRVCDYESPIGRMLLAADDAGLTGAWFYGQRYFARGLEDVEKSAAAEASALVTARHWLDVYFTGERPDAEDVPLAPRGTTFQLRVWDALLAIPYGETCTYGELAAASEFSPRVVGAAVGKNPIAWWALAAPSPATPAALSARSSFLNLRQVPLDVSRCFFGDVPSTHLSFSASACGFVRRSVFVT